MFNISSRFENRAFNQQSNIGISNNFWASEKNRTRPRIQLNWKWFSSFIYIPGTREKIRASYEDTNCNNPQTSDESHPNEKVKQIYQLKIKYTFTEFGARIIWRDIPEFYWVSRWNDLSGLTIINLIYLILCFHILLFHLILCLMYNR